MYACGQASQSLERRQGENKIADRAATDHQNALHAHLL